MKQIPFTNKDGLFNFIGSYSVSVYLADAVLLKYDGRLIYHNMNYDFHKPKMCPSKLRFHPEYLSYEEVLKTRHHL